MDGSLIGVGLLSMTGVFVARVAAKELLYLIPRMAWLFLAIAIFPVLFTPEFYLDLPSWFPITVSHEGLALGLESSVLLLKILFISLVLVRTTSSEDWMSGLDKLLGPLIQRFPVIKELLAVVVMAVKFLPMILAETEDYFSSLHKKKANAAIKNYVQSFILFWTLLF